MIRPLCILALLLQMTVYMSGADAAPPKLGPSATSAPAKPVWAAWVGQEAQGFFADLVVAGMTQRMRWIQPGSFERGEADEKHIVTLTKGFWLGDSEVTQGMWQAVMGGNPSKFTGDASRPVEQVSWDDCQGFFKRLNGQVPGLTATFPTEAQWEYACRAGSDGESSRDLDAMAWCSDNAGSQTHLVKGRQANAFGLYDMLGNVSEWCSDWFDTYPAGAATDPLGSSSGSRRVIRGGSWYFDAGNCLSTIRFTSTPGGRFDFLGFRLLAQSTP